MATQKRKKFEGIKVVTPVFRASYLTVFEPKAYEDGEPKFSVEMLFDEKKSDLSEMRDKMKKVCEAAWGKDKAKWPKNFRLPFKKGDEKEDASEHYAGVIFARADSKNQPGIFDQEKNDILDKREIFSGCFCRASLFMVPYENIGGKGDSGRSGIKLYLQGIQLIKKGEAFGNTGSRDDFGTVENDESEEEQESNDEDAGW